MDPAIAYSQKALEIDPSQAVAHSALGLAYLRRGRVDDAVLHLQKAAAITPNSAAHSNLGVALLQMGRVDDALIQYAKAVESDPSNVDPQNNMAWVLATWPEARIRNAQKAVEMAERANSLKHQNKRDLGCRLC
ncbi:MAG: tetratricopeptide repeat protein [Chthoniobacterales bacterium]|nr:tetratricopeptide repeat protein [Chthoniobacterales bacterium]